MSNTYCVACNQSIIQIQEKAANGEYALVWTSERTDQWTCDHLGYAEHIPSREPLDDATLYAVLMNYIGELDMKNEAREGEDLEVIDELDRVYRLLDERGLVRFAGVNLGELR